MGVLLPQFNDLEKTLRIKTLQRTTLFPVTTTWNKLGTTANYPTADAALGYYRSATLIMPNAVGIMGLGVTSILTGDVFDYFIVAVSYSPVFTVADSSASITIPDDSGNIIYRGQFMAVESGQASNQHVSFQSDTYYLEANKPLYVHQWISAAAATAGGMLLIGSVTLHLKQTGLRG